MLSADARSLRSLGRALRGVDAALYREVQKALRVEGRKIADRARQNASWSKQIPPSITVSTAGVNAVRVRATAPNAGPYEHAGKRGAEVRHPVFGVWQAGVRYDMSRPFLHPAALDHLEESSAVLAEALTVRVDQIIHGQDVAV